MKNIIAFATILSLITIASLCFAQDEFTISGRVQGIDNGTISLEEPNGEIFNIAAKNNQLSGIEVGDSVVVRVAGGWAVSIVETGKARTKQQAKRLAIGVATAPNYTPTEIIGEVTLVSDGMLKVKDDSTQMEYDFTASSDKLSDIKTGYRVEVRAINGRALSLIRLGMPMQSQSESSQRWKVIKYSEQRANEPPSPPTPPLHMEQPGIAPSTTSAWIPSHWEWNGRQWAWIPGGWMEPPYTGAFWVPSHWGWNGHEWLWIPGHWMER